MKTIFTTLIIMLSAVLVYAQNYINIGSTKSSVRTIMGEPNSVRQMINTEVWTYGNEGLATLTFENGKVIEYSNYRDILPIGKISNVKKLSKKKEMDKEDWSAAIEEAKRLAAAENATTEKSVFGTHSSQFTSTSPPPINYSTFEGGKYAKVAKAQQWDAYIFPSNAEQKLNEYNMKRYLMFGTLGLGFLLIMYFLLKKKKKIDPINH